MGKPGKALDVYEFVQEVRAADNEIEQNDRTVFVIDSDGCHHTVARVYVDDDRDMIIELAQ